MSAHLGSNREMQLDLTRDASTDRPRTGANQTGAGSPITQLGAQEVSSMTDAGESVNRWVPPVGMLTVAPERTAVIRGLFELAAFVAEHPQFGLPFVEAVWLPCEESFSADMRVVEAAGEALGVTPALAPGAGYSVRTKFASPMVNVRFTAHPIATGGEGR